MNASVCTSGGIWWLMWVFERRNANTFIALSPLSRQSSLHTGSLRLQKEVRAQSFRPVWLFPPGKQTRTREDQLTFTHPLCFLCFSSRRSTIKIFHFLPQKDRPVAARPCRHLLWQVLVRRQNPSGAKKKVVHKGDVRRCLTEMSFPSPSVQTNQPTKQPPDDRYKRTDPYVLSVYHYVSWLGPTSSAR